MDAFASAVELADRMQRDLASISLQAASAELVAATARVREEARQEISLVVDDVVRLDGTGGRRLLLPEIPVVSIASVVVDGAALWADDDYYATFDSGILWRARGGAWLPLEPRVVEVTYTHGYAEIPQALKDVVLESAMRAMLNPRRVAQESLEGYSARFQYFQHEIGGALLPSERRVVANYAAR